MISAIRWLMAAGEVARVTVLQTYSHTEHYKRKGFVFYVREMFRILYLNLRWLCLNGSLKSAVFLLGSSPQSTDCRVVTVLNSFSVAYKILTVSRALKVSNTVG